MVGLARPFPRHIPFDLLDYLLGMGWVTVLIGFFAMARMGRGVWRIFAHDGGARLTFFAIVQVLVVALTALLPAETARIWMPYMPLFMPAVGVELAMWTPRARLAAYACLLLITIVIAQNMIFIYMGPELDGPRW
jgi:hypothetical protein